MYIDKTYVGNHQLQVHTNSSQTTSSGGQKENQISVTNCIKTLTSVAEIEVKTKPWSINKPLVIVGTV